ncbi:anhydro-N-acetylmuramic acid kinase [Coniosporium apollinis CBS 100218]|uniref:Anhydro-N-acetylmuramic acid kinase n=1 Tax=Coniosporium apollinis (strain CBS 100218) TaxID=1168221 RepID=R7YW09_CONA1|nr:anhydro-N-acetylmuramic acid kinase [Coniosporium apollinis CBS 100218]EON65866.1 anhydro-N-acetylmuramic acid kinase [Coniosporium apollinis CBS 100218]
MVSATYPDSTNGHAYGHASNGVHANGLSSGVHRRADGSLDVRVLGLNSGTAMDGIDCALVHYRQSSPTAPLHMNILKYDEIPVPQWIKKPVLKMLRETKTTPSLMSQLNVQLGVMFGEAVKIFCDKHDIAMDSIDLIGSHGQTIWLLSMPKEGETQSAFCLGEGTVISAMTGITTVTDFRMAEQAVGRQGAPLVALIDGLLLHHPTKLRVCQNIGGIANLCIIPPDSEGGVDAMIDWDCGPGNMFIDAAMRYFTNGKMEYDKDGEWGARGTVSQSVVDRFLRDNAYVNHPPPKTTGRETFGDGEAQQLIDECLSLGLSKYDTLATITRITAQNIVKQYRTFFPRHNKIGEIFMCGGGARNPNIINYLRQELPNTRILKLDETGVPSDAKEAVSFAQQALEAILGRAALVPINSDTLTPNTISGKIAPGLRWREIMFQAINFGRGEPLPTVKEMVVDRKYTDWKP